MASHTLCFSLNNHGLHLQNKQKLGGSSRAAMWKQLLLTPALMGYAAVGKCICPFLAEYHSLIPLSKLCKKRASIRTRKLFGLDSCNSCTRQTLLPVLQASLSGYSCRILFKTIEFCPKGEMEGKAFLLLLRGSLAQNQVLCQEMSLFQVLLL